MDATAWGTLAVVALAGGYLATQKGWAAEGFNNLSEQQVFMADKKPLVGEDTGRWFLGEMAMKFAQSPQTLIAWEQRGCCPFTPIKATAEPAKIERVIHDSMTFMRTSDWGLWDHRGDIFRDAEEAVYDPQRAISTIIILPDPQFLPMNCEDAIVRRIAPRAQTISELNNAWVNNPPTKAQQERYWAWLRTNYETLLLGRAHQIQYHYQQIKWVWWSVNQVSPQHQAQFSADCITAENIVFDSASPPNRKYNWDDYDPSEAGLILNNVAPMVDAMDFAMRMRQQYPQVKLLQASKMINAPQGWHDLDGPNDGLLSLNVFQNLLNFVHFFRAKASVNDDAYIRDVNVKPGEYGDSPWTPQMVEGHLLRQAKRELEESEQNLQTAIAKRDAALNDPLAFFEGYIKMSQDAFDFDVKTKKSIVESCKDRLKKP